MRILLTNKEVSFRVCGASISLNGVLAYVAVSFIHLVGGNNDKEERVELKAVELVDRESLANGLSNQLILFPHLSLYLSIFPSLSQ